MRTRHLRHLSAKRRGTVAIEFALTLSLLVVVALSISEIGIFLSQQQRFVQATFEATRFAAITPGSPTQADVLTHALYTLEQMGMPTSDLSLSAVWATDGTDQIVTVTMQLPATALAGFVSLPASYSQQFTAVVRPG
ncbi:MAG: hypothetical protein GXP62_06975 [Oligoflexia bacterium]|nr:hypothetical protein [Oligoflexia bacterium]